jgi:alkylation response protein AidB-like acyl-CoA dehydrogenase
LNFTFTSEQEELRSSLRRFLADKSSSVEVRRLMESDDGYDPLVWKQMADQLGLQGLAIPEEYGGSGYSAVELGLVFEEMGRALLCAPYFSTVALAAQLLLSVDDEASWQRWLPRIAEGSLIATVAVTDEEGSWDLAAVTTSASQSGDGWTLDGVKMFVVDGRLADLLLVVARTDDGLGVFAVDKEASGVTRTALAPLDLTRPLARIELSGAPAQRVGTGDATGAIAHALDLALVALAAEQSGGAERALEMAVDYAKIRVQFGRPIGSFQAIKHKCADMLLEVESAKSASYFAAWSAAEGSDELPVAAALAKAYCSDAFFHVAAENIQIHGGIGFTWEHDAHLYFRRAKSSQLLFGDPQHHRRRLADLVGI